MKYQESENKTIQRDIYDHKKANFVHKMFLNTYETEAKRPPLYNL